MRLRAIGLPSVAAAVIAVAAGDSAAPAQAAPPPAPSAKAGTRAPESDPEWLASARRLLSEREYRASENGGGLQAPNRRHELRTYFAATGVRVHDRERPGEPRLFSLELVGLGRGSQLEPVPPGRVSAAGARVE